MFRRDALEQGPTETASGVHLGASSHISCIAYFLLVACLGERSVLRGSPVRVSRLFRFAQQTAFASLLGMASKGSLTQTRVVVPAPTTVYVQSSRLWDGHAPHSHPDSSDVRHPKSATELLIQRSHSRGQGTKLYATPSGDAIAYGAGRTAVIRSIGGPDAPTSAATSEPLLFTHAQPVTVVRPLSEYYAASGDAAGNVKVWDTASGNYSLKLEAKPIARINDIAVDGEGQRIIVVGEGKSAFGASFSLSTGSSIGEISGHSKVVNAVAMRPGRPFKAV